MRQGDRLQGTTSPVSRRGYMYERTNSSVWMLGSSLPLASRAKYNDDSRKEAIWPANLFAFQSFFADFRRSNILYARQELNTMVRGYRPSSQPLMPNTVKRILKNGWQGNSSGNRADRKDG
jgi:hypothetical protein